jgi:hypothetical protein
MSDFNGIIRELELDAQKFEPLRRYTLNIFQLMIYNCLMKMI